MPDWTETALDSCVDLTKGVTYAAADYAGKGQGHPFLTIKSVKKGGGFNEEGLKYYKGPYKTGQVVKPGDLLVALTDLTRAGDIIGGPFRVPELGTPVVLPSMDLAVLREGDEPIDFSYLAYRLMLHDARRYMLARSAGTTVLHLDSAAALKFSFSRPGFEVQQRIAEILSTVDEAIEQTEALIAKTRQIKAGLMHDLFTRGVTPDGQLRPTREEAPQLYKESPLGWVPKEWFLHDLATIAETVIDGPFGSNLKSEHYVESGGVRVVRLQNILEGEYNDRDKALISTEHARYLVRHTVLAGDVLIAALGEDSYPVGRSCSYPEELPPAVNKADCFRLRCVASLSLNSFIMNYLNSSKARNQIRRYEQGVTRRRINLGNLKRVVTVLPNIQEQTLIVARIESCANQILNYEVVLEKFLRVKNGLMSNLLNGDVEVSA